MASSTSLSPEAQAAVLEAMSPDQVTPLQRLFANLTWNFESLTVAVLLILGFLSVALANTNGYILSSTSCLETCNSLCDSTPQICETCTQSTGCSYLSLCETKLPLSRSCCADKKCSNVDEHDIFFVCKETDYGIAYDPECYDNVVYSLLTALTLIAAAGPSLWILLLVAKFMYERKKAWVEQEEEAPPVIGYKLMP